MGLKDPVSPELLVGQTRWAINTLQAITCLRTLCLEYCSQKAKIDIEHVIAACLTEWNSSPSQPLVHDQQRGFAGIADASVDPFKAKRDYERSMTGNSPH